LATELGGCEALEGADDAVRSGHEFGEGDDLVLVMTRALVELSTAGAHSPASADPYQGVHVTTSIGERPTISAAIIVRDGRLLLVQRRVKEGSLSWRFPAGEVEPGETVEDAVVRERVRKSVSP
jgi:hypothetical protein